MTPKTKLHFNPPLQCPHPLGVSLVTTTSLDSPDPLSTKAREGGPLNVIVDEGVVAIGGMSGMKEAPVSLIPGIYQVLDQDPATVTLGNKNHYFVSTVRRTTINKNSFLLELKTIHLVSETTVLTIILNNRATNNIPTVWVMTVKVKCILFFTFRLNDPSH